MPICCQNAPCRQLAFSGQHLICRQGRTSAHALLWSVVRINTYEHSVIAVYALSLKSDRN
eukprot:1309786-Pleurochrysis_carterae.AAC.1